jgi:uncharacterized protein YbaR (Trm112 family)
MSIDAELLAILVCPDDKSPLTPANDELVAALNSKITAGEVKNQGEWVVERPMEAALVRADGKLLYPVRDGIPVLLKDEGIAL